MRSVVLSGFMATGKSSLGPVLSTRLGLPFLDTDLEIERRTGRRVPDLWREQGEASFRALEGNLVRELLADGVARVVSFGGGTVTIRTLRHLALDRAFVVTLVATPDTILSRIHDLDQRPTLAGPNPRGRIVQLLEDRAGAYAECHLRLDTEGLGLEDAAERIAVESKRTRLVVPLGERTYSVEVANDAPETLASALRRLDPSSVVVVTDGNVRAARGAALEASLVGLGSPVTEVRLSPGEGHKTLESVRAIWDAAVAHRADRQSVILAFGGGVVGDLAGFAASTLLRGVRFVQSPTTLLSMVDASVGGKTGFDLAAGKNLIGSFHQPSSVVVDLAHLATLPRREHVAGLAEVAKVALACDESLWLNLEKDAERLRDGELDALGAAIERAITLKARLVRDDEREGGLRALLNLGHTIGHAIETAGDYSRYLHGEAVAVGLVLEAQVAERLGFVPPGLALRVAALLGRLGLRSALSAEDLAAAWPRVLSDKKRVRASVAFPMLRAIGRAEMETVSVRELARALGLDPLGERQA